MSAHDVAIYLPDAANFYDAGMSYAEGGAGRQTFLLAQGLAGQGLRVAHIVNPVGELRTDLPAPVTIVEEPKPVRQGSARAFAEQARALWRALEEADAEVVIFRGASGAVGTGAAWARTHRRGLVFSGANDSDFGDGPFAGPRDPRRIAFRTGLASAAAVVTQSEDQAGLARSIVRRGTPRAIPSFVEPQPATERPGEAFLWVSRVADYKRPLAFVDLAEAVPEARFWMVMAPPQFPEEERRTEEIRRRAAALGNLELPSQRTHPELQDLIDRAVAMVNTSSFEGVPNTWLEGWARGVPALTLSFDPDGRIARHGLGRTADGDPAAFAAAARELWAARADRDGYRDRVRGYVADVHGERVLDAWLDVVRSARPSGRRRRPS